MILLSSFAAPLGAALGLATGHPIEMTVLAVAGTIAADRLPDADLPDAAWTRFIPVAHAAIMAVLLPAAAAFAADPSQPLLQRLGIAPAFGLYACTAGVNAAHELVHRRTRWERAVGAFTACMVAYGSFAVEHVRGHHVRVATPLDPSSAPAGMSVWRFLPRAIGGNIAHAWHLETTRLSAAGRSPWHPSNQLLQTTATTATLAALIGAWTGTAGVLFFAVQAAIATAALEINNYVEHYGLRRAKLPSGTYAPVSAHHCWNGVGAGSQAMFLSLPRHSDHHLRPARTFTALQERTGAPTLPYGYATMFFVAMVPPLWFRIMDPRLIGTSGGQAHTTPRSANPTGHPSLETTNRLLGTWRQAVVLQAHRLGLRTGGLMTYTRSTHSGSTYRPTIVTSTRASSSLASLEPRPRTPSSTSTEPVPTNAN